MQKILILFFMLSTLTYASYNPFFTDVQASKQKQQAVKYIKEVPYVKPKPIPQRKSIIMEYIGFIESHKGKFALVTFKGRNIVIRKDDSLYTDEKVFKIRKITSNYILLRDRYYRMQTVYFSSQNSRNSIR